MNNAVGSILFRFILDLRAAGLHEFADALVRAQSDRSRADTLNRHGSDIPLDGRNAFLRRASAGLWAAYDALARASIEAERAAAALDTYHSPKGSDT